MLPATELLSKPVKADAIYSTECIEENFVHNAIGILAGGPSLDPTNGQLVPAPVNPAEAAPAVAAHT